MKIVRFDCADGAACRAMGWLRGCNVGLIRLLEDEIGVARGESEKARVVVVVASLCDRGVGFDRGIAFARHLAADLLDILMTVIVTLMREVLLQRVE